MAIHRTTTSFTSLIYGPAEPPLIPGRKYAIRLKAYDRDGRDLFINSGYSEVRSFTFGEECKPPALQQTTIENYQKAKISWSPSPTNTDYTVRYRPLSDDKIAPWYYQNTLYSYANLDTLTEGLTYEMGIKANCGSITSDYIAGENFILPAKSGNTFECKVLAYDAGTLSTKPKPSLKQGDKVSIGGYDMTLTQVKGQDGKFSGKGIIVVPFLNNLKLSTHFQDIFVNENSIVTQGNAMVDRATLQAVDDKTKKQIIDGMNAIDKGFADTDQFLKKADDIIVQVNNIIEEAPEAAKVLLEKGKTQIEKGKQLIANGSTEAGKEMIEKGKQQIKDGLAKIKNGAGTAVVEGVEGLKALFQKTIQEISTALSKDSTALSKLIVNEEDEFEKMKKNYEGELYEPSTNEVWEEVASDLSDNDGVLEVVQESEVTTASKTPMLNKLNAASNTRHQSLLDLEALISKLKFLESYKVPDAAALDELIKDFKNESVALLKKYALDKLNGKEAEDLEKQIKKFIDDKMQEAISLVR